MTSSGSRAHDDGVSRLARLGFADPARAVRLLQAAPVLSAEPGGLLPSIAETADPDAALLALVRMVEAADDAAGMVGRLLADPPLRARLLAVLGASTALADHLARRPDDFALLRAPADDVPAEAHRRALLTAVGADPADPEPRATADRAGDELRVAYRRRLLEIAGCDLTGHRDLQQVARELSDLAAATLDAALAIARSGLPEGAAACRFAVIGMGKCGGRELNYVSDVDVVFVAEPLDHGAGADEGAALRTANLLAAGLMRACSAATPEGTIWPVDANLRPEGKNGPLVRTLASHRAYYERWAKTWEFQALLKARPVAGDRALGAAYVDAVLPLVWQAGQRPDFVTEVQQMRRRVEAHVPAREAGRQLKLGPGGLRDVEFSVQLLQLVHGRGDERLRSGNTIEALGALSKHGYVGRDDAAELDRAYRFLRSMEHRLQLHKLRRTHVVPEAESELRRLARSLGFRSDPVAELTAEWRCHAREVRRLHEKLFYRPLLHAVARLAPEEARLTREAARARLEALGYEDPAGALRHIEALTSGVSRRAAIQRTLLPVMLGWFAGAPAPDAGLLAFRQLSDALGSTHWYLRLLRDEGAAAERVAQVLASSRYAADLLLRAPEAVAMLGEDAELRPRPAGALESEVLASVRRHDDPTEATRAARAVRRRELFRVSVADLLGLVDVGEVGEALTAVARAAVAGALDAAARHIAAELRGPLPTRFAVIAMGLLGGRELGYGSDADALFVHDPLPGVDIRTATVVAHAVANEMRRLLALPAPDPPLAVDADLRPEGRQGPLVRTLASYAAYYERWSAVWETQALVRAGFLAGDPGLGADFIRLIDPIRWPTGGVSGAAVREIRRIKARVESERLPRGADPGMHTKLGPGGLADVEWTVQLLQLRHAGELPELRTTSTVAALRAAVAAGLLQPADGDALERAWLSASRIRNALMLARGRAGDSLPTDVRELSWIARLAGFPPGGGGQLVDEYRRTARRARGVVERVFYD